MTENRCLQFSSEVTSDAPRICFSHLPEDIIVRVSLLLAPVDIVRLGVTCKALHRIVNNDLAVWKPVCEQKLSHLPVKPETWLIERKKSACRSYSQGWPALTYRQLLCRLEPFLSIGGIWKGTSVHANSRDVYMPVWDHVMAFKWASAGLICLELKGTKHSTVRAGVDLQWQVYFTLSKSAVAPPQVDQLSDQAIKLQVNAIEQEATTCARDKAATALGACQKHCTGTSPPGSFESELLSFMANMQTPPRVARRSMRRKSSPSMHTWNNTMLLRRSDSPAAHGMRSLVGIWAVAAHSFLPSQVSSVVELSISVASGAVRLHGTTLGSHSGGRILNVESLGGPEDSLLFGNQLLSDAEELVEEALSESVFAGDSVCHTFISPSGAQSDEWVDVLQWAGIAEPIKSGLMEAGSLALTELDGDVSQLVGTMSLDNFGVQWEVDQVLVSIDKSLPVDIMVHVVSSGAAHSLLVLGHTGGNYQVLVRVHAP